MTNKSIPKQVQNSIIIYSALGILVVSVIVSLVSIMPLFNHLKEDLDKDPLFAVRLRKIAVEEYLKRAKDITLQVTSRTMIRDNLEAFTKGEIRLEELVNFTENKLVNAMNLSDEVKGISCFDHKGVLLVQVGLPMPKDLWQLPGVESREAFIYGPITLGSESYLIVAAPILDRQSKQLGTDIVLFKVWRLQQIVEDYSGLGETGESVLGMECDGRVQLFFSLRGSKGDVPESFPKNSPLGFAFEKAFHQETGILKSSDSPDIIAYGPIQGSDWGL